MTVNLTGPSSEALGRIVASTGASKTDAINRAVQLYAWVQGQLESGGSLYIKEAGSEELERLKFL